MQTVVGLYDTQAKANDVKRILGTKGFNDVSVVDQAGAGYSTGSEASGADHESIGNKIKDFFSNLTGDDDAQQRYPHDHYTRGVANGGSLVAVHVEDSRAEEVADLLDQHGATEVQDDTADSSYAATGTGTGVYDAGDRNYGTGTGTLLAGDDTARGTRVGGDASLDANQSIPVVQEDLVVGKRQVRRGGVRVYSHLVSTPVSEQVNLHDERVVVDRRAVDRPATEADLNPEARSIELTAMGEEAVVGKNSRVVEEVYVGKQASDHVETVSDSVRHTEIDVESIEGDTSETRGTTNRY